MPDSVTILIGKNKAMCFVPYFYQLFSEFIGTSTATLRVPHVSFRWMLPPSTKSHNVVASSKVPPCYHHKNHVYFFVEVTQSWCYLSIFLKVTTIWL